MSDPVDRVADGVIPESVDYRPASDYRVACATCDYYEQVGFCRMFEADVEPLHVCDEWEPVASATAAAESPQEPVPAAHHNRVVRAATRRADDLTERLETILQPILERAGNEAASAFERNATNHLTAAFSQVFEDPLTAAADDEPGSPTMVALYPREEQANELAERDGDPSKNLHVTLAYLGKTEGPLTGVRDALMGVAAEHAPLEGQVGGVGIFGDNGNGHPAIALPSVPGLVELRVRATEALHAAGVDFGRDWGFQPHMTIGYRDDPVPPDVASVGKPLNFDSLWVVRGNDERVELPLTGAAPVTASLEDPLRAAGEPPPWTPPAPNEILDVEQLVNGLRTKTDPVRKAVIETVMASSLAGVGIAYDVTNPFIAKALETTGSQITNIAETTQVNVMRIIRTSYEQGLSIPDTATAIRAGMKEASAVRATLIARTEMVGAVNVASLESTKLVEGATGAAYEKVWMTAPGAPNPRHETYDGLDGQTAGLQDYFTVGDDQLQYPGDPSGSPEEVCNCRCTMSYVDSEGEDTGAEPVSDDEG